MNKNAPLNQRYICPIGADGIQGALVRVSSMGSTRAKAQAAPENGGLFRRRIGPFCSGIDKQATVAPVATVAVTVKLEPLLALSPDEEKSIQARLAHSEETDPVIITDALNKRGGPHRLDRDFDLISEIF